MNPPKFSGHTNTAALENADEGPNSSRRHDDLEKLGAEEGQQKTRLPQKTPGQRDLLRELRERVARSDQQDFHAQLDPALFREIMIDNRVRRGMPVFDSAFSAVKSGKNLFMQTSVSNRSLQYLLPIAQTFLETGVSRPQARHTFMLVLCATAMEMNIVRDMGNLLFRRSGAAMRICIMEKFSPQQVKKIERQGCDALVCTPEALLQWSTLGHLSGFLRDMLQSLQILVVDGQARSLRDSNFLECLLAVTERLPVIGGESEVQRVVVSDDHDPQLDELLKKLVLPGDHELLHDQELERIQELRDTQLDPRIKLMRRHKGITRTSRNSVDPFSKPSKHQSKNEFYKPSQRKDRTDRTREVAASVGGED